MRIRNESSLASIRNWDETLRLMDFFKKLKPSSKSGVLSIIHEVGSPTWNRSFHTTRRSYKRLLGFFVPHLPNMIIWKSKMVVLLLPTFTFATKVEPAVLLPRFVPFDAKRKQSLPPPTTFRRRRWQCRILFVRNIPLPGGAASSRSPVVLDIRPWCPVYLMVMCCTRKVWTR